MEWWRHDYSYHLTVGFEFVSSITLALKTGGRPHGTWFDHLRPVWNRGTVVIQDAWDAVACGRVADANFQFSDMCSSFIPDDMVVDGNISVDEWCDCFSFADDLRHEPPCHKAKHAVDPHMTGESQAGEEPLKWFSLSVILFFQITQSRCAYWGCKSGSNSLKLGTVGSNAQFKRWRRTKEKLRALT